MLDYSREAENSEQCIGREDEQERSEYIRPIVEGNDEGRQIIVKELPWIPNEQNQAENRRDRTNNIGADGKPKIVIVSVNLEKLEEELCSIIQEKHKIFDLLKEMMRDDK